MRRKNPPTVTIGQPAIRPGNYVDTPQGCIRITDVAGELVTGTRFSKEYHVYKKDCVPLNGWNSSQG